MLISAISRANLKRYAHCRWSAEGNLWKPLGAFVDTLGFAGGLKRAVQAEWAQDADAFIVGMDPNHRNWTFERLATSTHVDHEFAVQCHRDALARWSNPDRPGDCQHEIHHDVVLSKGFPDHLRALFTLRFPAAREYASGVLAGTQARLELIALVTHQSALLHSVWLRAFPQMQLVGRWQKRC